jgi:hypothetical protein
MRQIIGLFIAALLAAAPAAYGEKHTSSSHRSSKGSKSHHSSKGAHSKTRKSQSGASKTRQHRASEQAN